MVAVFFIYGLAFFVLGLAIIVYPKKGSTFRLAKHIWLIAGFGLLHGINEWLDMFILIQQPSPAMALKYIRIVTLPGSFLFLLCFGIRVIVEARRKYRSLYALVVVLPLLLAAISAVSPQRLLAADIWARYLLCAPGAFLTAVALLLQIPEFEKTKLYGVIRCLQLTAVAFLLYGVLAGLIVKKAPFLSFDLLTYDTFLNTFGVPVQIFRAFCAVIIACSTVYVLSVFRWETQQALRRSEQRCSMIASAVPIVFFGQDDNSVITFAYGKALDILGVKPDDLVGRRISEAFPLVPQFAEASRRALAGEEFIINIPIGKYVFKAYYSPLKDNGNKVTGLISVALDITSIVKAREELEKYRQKAERNAHLVEVGTLGSAMSEQLEEPLAVTRLLLQRLLNESDKASCGKDLTIGLKKSLLEVSKAAEAIEKFRNIAQISSESTTQVVDLYQLARRMLQVFAQTAERANLTISVRDINIIPYLSISERQLEQIFFALIQNAAETADPAKSQKLTISCKVNGNQIELIFSDTCGGMTAEKLKNIFVPFSITGSSFEEKSFGLAVAKQIACAHGGDILVESKPDQTTEFRVILPALRVAEA